MTQATISNNKLNSLISDETLIAAFATVNPNYRFQYQATYIPLNEENNVDNWIIMPFYANSKDEAVKVAREAGARIFELKLVYVYRAR